MESIRSTQRIEGLLKDLPKKSDDQLIEIFEIYSRKKQFIQIKIARKGETFGRVEDLQECLTITSAIDDILRERKSDKKYSPEIQDEDLLRLMTLFEDNGYKVTAQKINDNRWDIYCEANHWPNTKTNVIYYLKDSFSEKDLKTAEKSLIAQKTNEKLILTEDKSSIKHSITEELKNKNIQLRTKDEFYKSLLDVEHYKDNLKREISYEQVTKYAVHLDCTHNGQEMELDKFFLDWLKDESKNFLCILGGVGGGKTWFAYKAIAQQLKLLEDSQRPRIPILINLREYREKMDLKYLIAKHVSDHYDIKPPLGYNVFSHLNDQGCFLIILDGFDEMSLRIDQNTLFENLKKLMKLASHPNSKVLLTSRIELFRGRANSELISESGKENLTLLDYLNTFEKIKKDVVEIQSLSSGQIGEAIKKRGATPLAVERILKELKLEKHNSLSEIAKKPLFLGLIGSRFEELLSNEFEKINAYELLVDTFIERDVSDNRETMIPSELRIKLLTKLAYDFFKDEYVKSPISFEKLEKYIKGVVSNEIEKQKEKTETNGVLGKLNELLENSFASTKDLIVRGPLIADSREQYVFSHQIVEKFLASKYLFELWKNGDIKPLQIDEDIRGFLHRLWQKKADVYDYSLDNRNSIEVMIFIPKNFFISNFITSNLESRIIEIRSNNSFDIDKLPVTNKQYCDFLNKINDGKSEFEKWINFDYSRLSEKKNKILIKDDSFANHPVTGITREGALAFANFYGKNIPTFYEWEIAMRGIDGRSFLWGDEPLNESDFPLYDTFEIDSQNVETISVDKLSKSVWGCHCTIGYILEWTETEIQAHTPPVYVLKGGVKIKDESYDHKLRFDYLPAVENPQLTSKFIGFRCVKRKK